MKVLHHLAHVDLARLRTILTPCVGELCRSDLDRLRGFFRTPIPVDPIGQILESSHDVVGHPEMLGSGPSVPHIRFVSFRKSQISSAGSVGAFAAHPAIFAFMDLPDTQELEPLRTPRQRRIGRRHRRSRVRRDILHGMRIACRQRAAGHPDDPVSEPQLRQRSGTAVRYSPVPRLGG